MSCSKIFCECCERGYREGLEDGYRLGFKRGFQKGYVRGFLDSARELEPLPFYRLEIETRLTPLQVPPPVKLFDLGKIVKKKCTWCPGVCRCPEF